MSRRSRSVSLVLIMTLLGVRAGIAESLTKEEAAAALHKAVAFFRTQVSAHGGYLWKYSADLSKREGERMTGPETIWVQPPGTPTVGEAYLDVYGRTRDAYYLDAAKDAADALVNGQLRSGGWDYRIEFDPTVRLKYQYRVAPAGQTGLNVSNLDDDTTQAALRFLMRVDKVLEFKDPAASAAKIHEAVMYGLDSLLKAQRPSGGWPQRYAGPADPKQYPVKPASYPETWSRTYPKTAYDEYYTFNDNTISDAIDTMLDAFRTYRDQRYRASVLKAGDFILLAQMPEPQPAWAQQYDADVHPAWARKFEPPAVTGGESQGVMRTLLMLYRETGKKGYLESVSRALEYLKKSRLPDGRLARFYELQTNKPLYFTKEYELTYDGSDTPTHYSFAGGSALDAIEAEYKAAKNAAPAQLKAAEPKKEPRMTPELAARAQEIVKAMDERGVWVEDGHLDYQEPGDTTNRVIDCGTFVKSIGILGQFVAASR